MCNTPEYSQQMAEPNLPHAMPGLRNRRETELPKNIGDLLHKQAHTVVDH